MNEGFNKKYSSIEEIEAIEVDNDKFKNKIKTIESKESKILIIFYKWT